MPLITETIVTTRHVDGRAHLAPMGVHESAEGLVLAPFRPSATLDNLLRERCAVINLTDDVRVFAGCLTGRREWPLRAAERVTGFVLDTTPAHLEVEVVRIDDDAERPRLQCRVVHRAMHRPFRGMNRARAAVLEAAVLVSRIGLVSWEKIDRELEYLSIAIEKTAGDEERQAWAWLIEKIDAAR